MRKPLLVRGLGWFLSCDWTGSVAERGLNLVAAFLIGSCLAAHAEPLRIIIAGDGRAEYPEGNDVTRSPRCEDEDGINKVINREICRAVLKEKAEILLWTGDISNLLNGDENIFEQQLLAWRKIMQPLYDQGVKILPTRGNHEIVWHDPLDKSHQEQQICHAKETWTKIFSGPYAVQASGFDNEKLSFYYVRDPVLIIGLDHYEGRHSVDQTWLNGVLKDHKQPFIFAYGHEPAFAAGGSHGPPDTLAAFPQKRDRMWKSLCDAGAQVYFCGHDHFYDHMKVTAEDRGFEMHQVTAGTAGAPFDCHGPYPNAQGWKLKPVRHFDFTYGYILITIDGHTATIAFKGRDLKGQYQAKESFDCTSSAPMN